MCNARNGLLAIPISISRCAAAANGDHLFRYALTVDSNSRSAGRCPPPPTNSVGSATTTHRWWTAAVGRGSVALARPTSLPCSRTLCGWSCCDSRCPPPLRTVDLVAIEVVAGNFFAAPEGFIAVIEHVSTKQWGRKQSYQNLFRATLQSERGRMRCASAGVSAGEHLSALTLGALAFLLLISYSFYSFIVPQTPARLMRPSARLIHEFPLWSFIASFRLPILQTGQGVAILLVSFGLTAFTIYALALYVSWRAPSKPANIVVVLLAAVVFFAISAFSLPNFSTDIFDYIVRGRVATVYDSNPYYTPADRFPDDPIYTYASHQYTRLVADKMPTWMIINTLLARLTDDNPVTDLLVYRLVFMLFNLANVAIIGLIAHKLNRQHKITGIVAYAWNPIVALHGQGKADTVLVFFLLLAILLLIKTRSYLAIVSLTLSVFVKLITLPLMIVYLLREARLKRWRQLGIDTLLLLLTTLAIYAPFAREPGLILRHLSFLSVAGSAIPGSTRLLFVLAFGVFILVVCLFQDGSHEKLLGSWALVTLFFSLFLTKFGLSHYLITLVALTSLTLDWRILPITTTLSFSGFIFNTWYTNSNSTFPLPSVFTSPKFFIYLALPSIVTACLVAVLVWQGWQNSELSSSKKLHSVLEPLQPLSRISRRS